MDFLEEDSPDATKIIVKCPLCGNKTSKETKNDVTTICSRRGFIL